MCPGGGPPGKRGGGGHGGPGGGPWGPVGAAPGPGPLQKKNATLSVFSVSNR